MQIFISAIGNSFLQIMNRSVIPKTIEFIPNLNSRNVDRRIILSEFKRNVENSCCQKYGFILEVIEVKSILSNKLSMYNGKLILNCLIEIEHLLPQPKATVIGVIQQKFPQGLIVLVKNCMKSFIPCMESALSNLEVGDEIEFEISQIRFQKGKYDCIGDLVRIMN